jgi:hypothetical protein
MKQIAIIGAGPGGLMAAQVLSAQPGLQVTLYEAMPSAGRKFLQAGRGGLNLTHSEDFEVFVSRYGARAAQIRPWLQAFSPNDVRDWVAEFGLTTFVGSSGRVYSEQMKAAPLLRAWLARLRRQGLTMAMRHRWQGWCADGALWFVTPDGERRVVADAVVLALGGASWPHLGSDGGWTGFFNAEACAPWQPANCGFWQAWSPLFVQRFAGQPLKSVVLNVVDAHQQRWSKAGELMLTEQGVEGSLIYALSAPIRDTLRAQGQVAAELDLMPDVAEPTLCARLAKTAPKQSWSNRLKRAGVDGLRASLLREVLAGEALVDWARVAHRLKHYPLALAAPAPIAEAISSAGGLRFEALDEAGMVRSKPGVWCVGEMLDWEAPTGGYLLTAVLASAVFYAGHISHRLQVESAS